MILVGDVEIPRRATIGSAGYDFFAPKDYELRPGEWTLIDTGVSVGGKRVKMELSHFKKTGIRRKLKLVTNTYLVDRWEMNVYPRSGISSRIGLRIKTTVGVIDQDYMDTIQLLVTVDEPYTLKKGERFVQGVIYPFATFFPEMMTPKEERNGGHGSTGKF